MKILVSRKVWLISIAGALAAHFALYVLLGMTWSELPAKLTGDEEHSKTAAAAGGDDEGETSPPIDEQRLARQIDEGVRRLVTVPVQNSLEGLRKNASWLDKNSSAKSVDEISVVVRKATGAPERAYAPVTPPPPGEFDMKSMLPYESKQATGEDGLVRSEQTWVDKAGRTFKQTIRKGANGKGEPVVYRGVYMPDGKLFESESVDDGTQGVLDVVNQSPLLQKVFREGLLPALARQREKAQSEAPTAPGK